MIRQFPAPEDSPESSAVDDTPVVKMIYGLLFDCLRRRCERIHLFLSEDPAFGRRGHITDGEALPDLDDEEEIEYRTFTVREFNSGEWHDIMKPPALMYPPILQRLKVMAGFSLARRLPMEEGRFRLMVHESIYEIGVTVRTKPDGTEEAMVDLPSGPI